MGYEWDIKSDVGRSNIHWKGRLLMMCNIKLEIGDIPLLIILIGNLIGY